MRLIDADALIESLLIDPEECPGCPEPEWLECLILTLECAETVEPEHGGLYECFHCCTNNVIWDSDFSFEDLGLDGEGIVHYCHCANCGAEIEYYISLEPEV